jgi:hypothetical protein
MLQEEFPLHAVPGRQEGVASLDRHRRREEPQLADKPGARQREWRKCPHFDAMARCRAGEMPGRLMQHGFFTAPGVTDDVQDVAAPAKHKAKERSQRTELADAFESRRMRCSPRRRDAGRGTRRGLTDDEFKRFAELRQKTKGSSTSATLPATVPD